MTKTNEERYLEWLDREEEKLGSDFMERATLDIESFRSMLADELTPEALSGNIQAIIDAADSKYREYPEVSINFSRIQHAWGTQNVYRDTITGRFISADEVKARIAGWLG